MVTSNASSQVEVTPQQHQQTPGVVGTIPTSSAAAAAAAAYINQVNANQVTTNQPTKSAHETVKIIYPSSGQVIATTGVVNVNNKLSFPAQTVSQLANGTLGVTTQTTTLQNTSNVVTNVATVTQGVAGTAVAAAAVGSVNKTGGTALVIKTSGPPGGMVSVPMSVPVSVAGNAASTTMQAKAGVTSTIVPSNVQILNVNAMRPGTPVAATQPGKQGPQRVVIGQHIVNARPGAPGVRIH